MIDDITVTANIGIDQVTDELVLVTEIAESKTISRKPLSDFLSIPENGFVYVDEDWQIHVNHPQEGTIISDPISEDIRFEG